MVQPSKSNRIGSSANQTLTSITIITVLVAGLSVSLIVSAYVLSHKFSPKPISFKFIEPLNNNESASSSSHLLNELFHNDQIPRDVLDKPEDNPSFEKEKPEKACQDGDVHGNGNSGQSELCEKELPLKNMALDGNQDDLSKNVDQDKDDSGDESDDEDGDESSDTESDSSISENDQDDTRFHGKTFAGKSQSDDSSSNWSKKTTVTGVRPRKKRCLSDSLETLNTKSKSTEKPHSACNLNNLPSTNTTTQPNWSKPPPLRIITSGCYERCGSGSGARQSSSGSREGLSSHGHGNRHRNSAFIYQRNTMSFDGSFFSRDQNAQFPVTTPQSSYTNSPISYFDSPHSQYPPLTNLQNDEQSYSAIDAPNGNHLFGLQNYNNRYGNSQSRYHHEEGVMAENKPVCFSRRRNSLSSIPPFTSTTAGTNGRLQGVDPFPGARNSHQQGSSAMPMSSRKSDSDPVRAHRSVSMSSAPVPKYPESNPFDHIPFDHIPFDNNGFNFDAKGKGKVPFPVINRNSRIDQNIDGQSPNSVFDQNLKNFNSLMLDQKSTSCSGSGGGPSKIENPFPLSPLNDTVEIARNGAPRKYSCSRPNDVKVRSSSQTKSKSSNTGSANGELVNSRHNNRYGKRNMGKVAKNSEEIRNGLKSAGAKLSTFFASTPTPTPSSSSSQSAIFFPSTFSLDPNGKFSHQKDWSRGYT